MPATISQLQLDSYFLKEVSYSIKDNLDSIPERAEAIEPVGLEVSDSTTLNEEKQIWRCELIIESSDKKDKNSFYNFRIVMVGFFKTDSNLPPENAKILAESNCPAVLYSTSREIIATVTRRSPYPAILLPLVTFVKFVEEPKPKRRAVKKED